MATRQFDKLNAISKPEKKKRFEEYFGEMELPEEEIEERISLAEELEAVFKKLFVMLMAALATLDKSEINRQFYYDDAEFQYQEALANAGYPDLADQLSGYIGRTTMSIVDTTIDYSDTQFYVSDERAIFLAMDETNAVMNFDKEMKARAAGYTHKTWITKNDNRVRDTHVLMNGKTTEINNTFHVGIYEMRFPLDVMLGAGPEEVVRCRCVCKYLKDAKFQIATELRNSEPLTQEQIDMCIEYARQLGYNGGIEYSEDSYTSYNSGFDFLIIGTDVFPNLNQKDANSLIGWKGAIAHEVKGHYEAAQMGWTQNDKMLEEAQASFRASRLTPDLSNEDREYLWQDGIDRLTRNGYTVDDVIDRLHLEEANIK